MAIIIHIFFIFFTFLLFYLLPLKNSICQPECHHRPYREFRYHVVILVAVVAQVFFLHFEVHASLLLIHFWLAPELHTKVATHAKALARNTAPKADADIRTELVDLDGAMGITVSIEAHNVIANHDTLTRFKIGYWNGILKLDGAYYVGGTSADKTLGKNRFSGHIVRKNDFPGMERTDDK